MFNIEEDVVQRLKAIGAGTNAQPMNPWHSIYYMVSGRNVAGYRVNEGQTISRIEALRLYTLGSAWFSHDEEQPGSDEWELYNILEDPSETRNLADTRPPILQDLVADWTLIAEETGLQ